MSFLPDGIAVKKAWLQLNAKARKGRSRKKNNLLFGCAVLAFLDHMAVSHQHSAQHHHL
jgi:hypothetical protein